MLIQVLQSTVEQSVQVRTLLSVQLVLTPILYKAVAPWLVQAQTQAIPCLVLIPSDVCLKHMPPAPSQCRPYQLFLYQVPILYVQAAPLT